MPKETNNHDRKGPLSNIFSFFDDKKEKVEEGKFMRAGDKVNELIEQSDFISRI